jgi:hypothetical protein
VLLVCQLLDILRESTLCDPCLSSYSVVRLKVFYLVHKCFIHSFEKFRYFGFDNLISAVSFN